MLCDVSGRLVSGRSRICVPVVVRVNATCRDCTGLEVCEGLDCWFCQVDCQSCARLDECVTLLLTVGIDQSWKDERPDCPRYVWAGGGQSEASCE